MAAQIAITSCSRLEDYKHAVLNTGGEVHVVDHTMTVDEALKGADGLLLTGGDDVAPARYGEEHHPAVKVVPPERDEFEIALIKEARKRKLPILAICRGIQVLNVAAGGTLIQDIPTQVTGALEHKQGMPQHKPFDLAHEIWIEKDSLLAKLMRERLSDTDSCEVNSRHHQSVKAVAPGFQVSATAPDGVIEAIEDPAAQFCLGVQWHPENFWRTGEFRPLFEGFMDVANKTANTRS
jgi:putative glutamine amidotransferase